MKKIKNLKVRATALSLLTAGSLFTLSGCNRELAPAEEYDSLVESYDEEGTLFMGLPQLLDVPGEDFKLVTEYTCDSESSRAWRITSDKFLYLKVYTKGLPEGYQVYIDNIHIDTSVKSKYAAVDGILQDSMDDHIHNSLLIGFYISDDDCYYGVNAIEGANQDFINVSTYAFNNVKSVALDHCYRFVESEYIDLGVYANKISIVYDLLVRESEEEEFRNISVKTDFLVPISNGNTLEENATTGKVRVKEKDN